MDFLRQLYEQMLTYYQMPPQDDDLPRDADRLEALYAHLLHMPLVRPDQPLILVIDGLDEAEERFVFSDRYLPRTLPLGKFVIMAARATGENYLARLGLAHDQMQTLTLTTLDTAGIADLLRRAGGVSAAWADDPPRREAVERVSQGDPFYLHYLVQDIRDGRIGADDLARQPVGLTGYLDGWWRSVEEHTEQQSVNNLLGYLSIAHGPLTRADLITIRPDDALQGRTIDGTLPTIRRCMPTAPAGRNTRVATHCATTRRTCLRRRPGPPCMHWPRTPPLVRPRRTPFRPSQTCRCRPSIPRYARRSPPRTEA